MYWIPTGETPLFYAVSESKTKAAIHLMKNGVDVNLCTSGDHSVSVLYLASQIGNLEIMDCLIEAGGDLKVLDSIS
jgi:ankyrin repeat protein